MSPTLKKLSLCSSLAVLAGFRVAAVDITIQDPFDDAKVGDNDTHLSPNHPENGYVEWNSSAFHSFDLQSFEVTGTSLKMTAGLNFGTGGGEGPNSIYEMGDIFVYLNKTPFTISNSDATIIPNGPFTGASSWDYVIHFDRTADGPGHQGDDYKIVAGKVQYEILTPGQISSTINTGSDQPSLLNGLPLRVTTAVTTWGQAAYTSSGSGPTFENDVSGIDLSLIDLALGAGGTAYFSTTMSCGNDIMWGGQPSPLPDGGMTLTMLGSGLVGLAFLRHRLA